MLRRLNFNLKPHYDSSAKEGTYSLFLIIFLLKELMENNSSIVEYEGETPDEYP